MKMNKKIIAFVFISLFLGCVGEEKREKTISIAGSTTVQPISDRMAEAFMKKYDINVTVQGLSLIHI